MICIVIFCWYVNKENYKHHLLQQENIVNHPENLPNKDIVHITSIGFKNLMADIYWLRAIQYIWGNAIEAEYKKYLFAILDLITELNPYFESPYIVGQLLLPDYNSRYEKLSGQDQSTYIKQGEQLGLKWIENFCNPEILDKIFREDNLGVIWKDDTLKNPCKTYSIPYYLAYIYFFYLNDPLNASKYYKVASANENAPEGAKILAAIMQWKWGEREKSLYMFLSLAQSVEQDDSSCIAMSQELQQVYLQLSEGNMTLNGKLIQVVENSRKSVFPTFSREVEEEVLNDTKCINFVNKAIRELNLLYISQANKAFMKDHPDNLPARNAMWLFKEWYIDFLPTDYQQYEEYGIIYVWDYKNKRYDYEMGTYQ